MKNQQNTSPCTEQVAKKIEAHVICNNDSVEFVVIGDYKAANAKCEELAEAYYARNKGAYGTRETFRARCYWHIHTVNGIDTSAAPTAAETATA